MKEYSRKKVWESKAQSHVSILLFAPCGTYSHACLGLSALSMAPSPHSRKK